MNSKDELASLAVGFALGAAVGAVIGLLYAPGPGSGARELMREKLGGEASPFRRMLFNLKWITMSPRERYSYLWAHGGSLHDWRPHHDLAETD